MAKVLEREISIEEKDEIYDEIKSHIKYHEDVRGCLNCGICSGWCPSHRFYDFSPRIVIQKLLSQDSELVYDMMEQYIWACAQCMACAMTCPFGNSPGGAIMIMREVAVRRNLPGVDDILRPYSRVLYKVMSTGNQLSPDMIQPEFFPDWGPEIKWAEEDLESKRKAIPVPSMQSTRTAWKVHPQCSFELFTIHQEAGVLDVIERVDPNLYELVTDLVEETREAYEEEMERGQ